MKVYIVVYDSIDYEEENNVDVLCWNDDSPAVTPNYDEAVEIRDKLEKLHPDVKYQILIKDLEVDNVSS